VGVQMGCRPHMHQMMPLFHFAQPMAPHSMPYSPLSPESNPPEPSSAALTESTPSEEGDATSSPAGSTAPEHMNLNSWPQMPQAPWNGTGMMQYAMVPVAVPMQQQHNMNAAMSYACYTPQHHQQMPWGNAQWFVPMSPEVAPHSGGEAVEGAQECA